MPRTKVTTPNYDSKYHAKRFQGAMIKDELRERIIHVVASMPTYEMAKAQLAYEGHKVNIKIMRRVAEQEAPERVQELRKRLAPAMEAVLNDEMLVNAQLATKAERKAILRAQERLDANADNDPSRVARDLSQVRSQAIDKRLSLEGRPQKIIGKIDVDEIVRGLEGLGAAKRVETIEVAVEDDE